ncbi:Hypothetical protein HEAR2623 [Herminiimonas arsenicoxydans]|uniref:Uncharacterized protein n=1 Tax=Herminiimonas arsenicoxydans TaxID=204773 RepID=A4G8A8_HERAR|nr:Hypothetical protein HEAR2623 [Herminiimonas arsenicoxydans]
MPSKTEIISTDKENGKSVTATLPNARTGSNDTDMPASPPDVSTHESGLNNMSPTPPKDVQVRLRKAAEESDKLDSPERTNDSTIDPNKPKKDLLKGFHGG